MHTQDAKVNNSLKVLTLFQAKLDKTTAKNDFDKKDFTSAETLFKKALAVFKTYLSPNDEIISSSYFCLGSSQWRLA